MTRLVRGRWKRIVGAAAMAAAVASPASGQEPAAAAAETSRQVLARSVARLALLDLRSAASPTDSDYALACSLLGIARQMRPGDADLLRRQIEAAYAAGDQGLVLELTRALIQTPSGQQDTVAILRLISAKINAETQTAEERLAVYERFLTDKSMAGYPEILSRLALDAALILRERGDTEGFVAKLKRSLELDRTHKEAALIAATFFSERMPGDRVGRLTLLQNLLLADPVDPNVHFSIARELAAGRAFKGAARFHGNGLAIVAQQSQVTAELDLERRVLEWDTRGPTVMTQKIREQIAAERARAAEMIRRATAAGMSLERLTRPEDVVLPVGTGLALALASHAAGDTDGVRAALNEMGQSATVTLRGLQEAVRGGRLAPGRAEESAAGLSIMIQQARLWTNQGVEDAAKDIEQSPGLKERHAEEFGVLTGWLALRQGDAARAADLLAGPAATNVSASAGLGLAREALGDREGAVASLQHAVDLDPLGAGGAWARSKLESMGVKDDAAQVAALERAVEGTPLWVDDMIASPWKYLDLRLSLAKPEAESWEDVPVRITLQNLAPVPLALGSDRPLNSRVLLVPTMDVRAAALTAFMRPEVVDIDRRLRLMPRETVTVEVDPDLGQTGWVMEALAGRATRVRWRGIQGFQIAPGGGYVPGVMCVSGETESATRRPVTEANLTPAQLAERIAGASSAELPRLSALVRWMVFDPLMFPPPEEMKNALPDLEPAGRALAARYAGLPPVERACVAALVPHARLSPAMAPLDEAMKGEQHPLPLSIILVTRVVDPGDAALARAAGSPDESLRGIAARVAERLGGKDRLYCRMTAGDFARTMGPGGAPSAPAESPPAPGGAPAGGNAP